MEKLQNFYDEAGYNVSVNEEIKFEWMSVLKCEEHNPCGKNTFFEIIEKDGKFLNSNLEDIVEIDKDSN